VAIVIAIVVSVLMSPAKVRAPMAVATLIASKILDSAWTAMLIEVLAPVWILASIPVVPIKVVIHVAPEPLATVVPGTGAYEDSAWKPLGSIVAVRRAIVWRVVEVPVGAHRWWSDLHCDLRVQLRWR